MGKITQYRGCFPNAILNIESPMAPIKGSRTSKGTRLRCCVETVQLILLLFSLVIFLWIKKRHQALRAIMFNNVSHVNVVVNLLNKFRLLFVQQHFPTMFTTGYLWNV